jgi:hypothetical protein
MMTSVVGLQGLSCLFFDSGVSENQFLGADPHRSISGLLCQFVLRGLLISCVIGAIRVFETGVASSGICWAATCAM